MIICTNRRSISSVIGGAIFLVLFISGFTVFMFAIQVTSDRFSEQLSSSFEDTLRAKETFTIAPSVNLADKLFVQVFNQGPDPLNVQQVFVSNVATGTFTGSPYDVSFQDAHVAPNESKNVLENFVDNPITISTTGVYDVKVVTEQGTMVTQSLSIPLDPFFADLFTIPKAIGTGQDVTIAMLVYNRGNATIFNVSPLSTATGMTVPVTSISGITVGPNPSSINSLEPQESVLFTWEQTVIGAVGTSIEYTNSATGTDGASGDTLTSSTDSSSVTFVPQAVSLLQAPEITFIIPNPSGEGDDDILPLWGLNIINPTSVPITVSRVIFTAASNSGLVTVFQDGCENDAQDPTQNIAPNNGGNWTCPANNVLMWEHVSAPETIEGKDTKAWMVRTLPSIISSADDPATIVSATVFTSFGPFTEIGSTTGVIDAGGNDGSVVSMLASSSTGAILDGDNILITTNIIGNLRNVCSGTSFNLNFFVASLANASGSDIEIGTFIVNVPAGFAVGDPTDNDGEFPGTGNTEELTVTNFSDGSNQIKGVFENIAEEAFSVSIPLTAPNVTANALYIIFGLVEGITVSGSEHPVGPILEFPIQVLDLDTDPCPPV